MSDMQLDQADTTVVRRGLKVRVFGVGGAGGNAVGHLARMAVPELSLTILNTDAQALAASEVADRLPLGDGLMRGLGTGGDPALGRAAAEADEERLRQLCTGYDLVFVLAGLGGGTGTGAGPVLARVAREAGALVLGVVTLPFDCEGSRRRKQAMLGLAHLKAEADGVICLPNQKVFQLIDEQTSLVQTFHTTNQLIADGVLGVWRLVTRTGLINIDFADLRTALRGRQAESCFAAVEATGPNRARDAAERLFASPFLEGGKLLAGAQSVLVSIMGGADLTMAEVDRLMEQINQRCEGAHLILGAGVHEDFAQRLSVTLVASRFAPETAAGAEGPGQNVTDEAPEVGTQFLHRSDTSRPAPRFVPPAPELSAERAQELLARQPAGRGRRKTANALQQQLPLDIVSKGRFEKSEPTIHKGEDLDIPTYIRRGILLN